MGASGGGGYGYGHGYGKSRIDLAKEALSLFVRSLPKGCTFTIISFGSRFDTLWFDDKEVITFNDRSK